MASERLQVILELITSGYKREAKEAATATGQIGNSARSATRSLGMMLGPAAIGGAIAGLGRMAVAAGENADRLFDLQAQTGLSTDALQQWEFVAKAAGATTEVFSDAVKAVIRNLSDTDGATGAAAKAYDALSISVLGANGELRDAGTITEEVFAKLAGMENITARNALAQDIFGKKWEETISILDLGTDALGNLREEGKKGVVSAEALRNADKFRETWQKFVATVGPKLNEVLGQIAPALTDIAEGAIDTLDALEPLIDAFGFVADRYADLKGGLDDLEASDNAFLEFLGTAGNMVVGFGGGIGSLATGFETLSDGTQKTADKMKNVADAAPGAAEGIDDVGDAAGIAAGKVKTLADRQKELADRLLAQSSPLFAAIDEWGAYGELLQQIDEDGERTNEELFQLAEQTLQTNAALADLGGGNLERGIQSLATALGVPRDVIVDMLKQLGILNNTTARPRVILDVVSAITGRDTATGGGSGRTYIGGKQHGGPVRGGTPYLVGERGPEIMVPSQSGTVLPNGWQRSNVSITVQSPMNDFRSDLQYATILASVTNLVEGF